VVATTVNSALASLTKLTAELVSLS